MLWFSLRFNATAVSPQRSMRNPKRQLKWPAPIVINIAKTTAEPDTAYNLNAEVDIDRDPEIPMFPKSLCSPRCVFRSWSRCSVFPGESSYRPDNPGPAYAATATIFLKNVDRRLYV